MSASDPRGRHKARVFREALELERGDAAWLREVLVEAARSSEAQQVTTGCIGEPMRPSGGRERAMGKDGLVVRSGEDIPDFRHLLGVVMGADKSAQKGLSFNVLQEQLALGPAVGLRRPIEP